jgi:alpha-L-arabinofuranosidase
LPVLDSVAVGSEDLSKLYIYLVNRSLTDDVDVQIFLENTPSPIDSIVADTITADDFTAENTLAQPNAVEIVNTVLAVNKDISLNLKAHSLVRITVSLTND